MEENNEAQTPAEAVETPEITTESSDSTPLSWENLEFKFEPEAPAQDVAVSESPSPSEAPSDVETKEETETAEEAPTEEEEPIEARIPEDADKPTRLSRRQGAKVIDTVIEPFRDEKTPIGEVVKSLWEFHPTRTQALADELVHASIESNPDAWLKHITGMDVTVEGLKARIEGGKTTNPAPATEFEQSAEGQKAISYLTEVYGDDWKNPANDSELVGDDATYVPFIRSLLEGGSQLKSAHDSEIKALKDEIASLKPQIDEIKTQKEREYEAKREEIFTRDVDEYFNAVEAAAFPKVIKAMGLEATESDTAEVKSVKNLLSQKLSTNNPEFQDFLEKSYSERERLTKASQRVGAKLNAAADLELGAVKNPKEAARLKAQAEALRSQARIEQDSINVWAQKAGKEFLETKYDAIWRVLEENAELKRRTGGRNEIVSNTSAVGVNTTHQRVQQAAQSGSAWDADFDFGGR